MFTAKDLERGVMWSQVGLTFLSYCHMILVVAWAIGGLLDGFSNGILHVPPIAYEIILVKLISDTIGFGVDAVNRQFIVAVDKKHRTIVLLGVMLVIGIVLNLIHLVFTSIELNKCESVLCDNNYWFLFIFAFILGILAVLEGVMLWFFVRYHQHLKLFRMFISKK